MNKRIDDLIDRWIEFRDNHYPLVIIVLYIIVMTIAVIIGVG